MAVSQMNERIWGGTMDGDNLRSVVQQMDGELAGDNTVARSVEINPMAKTKLSFERFVRRRVQNMIDGYVTFCKKFTKEEAFPDYFLEVMFQHYLEGQQPRPCSSSFRNCLSISYWATTQCWVGECKKKPWNFH